MEPDDEIVVTESATMRDYFKMMRENMALNAWLWREFINDSAKSWIKRAYALSLISRAISLVLPYMLGLFVAAISEGDGRMVLFAIIGTIAAQELSTTFEKYMGHYIELTLGENTASAGRKINELFFGKNLGLHIKENSKLTHANMEKGINRFQTLQQTLLFDGMDSFNSLITAWMLLMILSPVSGLIVLASLAANVWVSLILNKMVTAEMGPVDAEFRRHNRKLTEIWEHVERVITTGNGARETEEMDNDYRAILQKDRKIWFKYITYTAYRNRITTVTITAVMGYLWYLGTQEKMSIALMFPILTWTGMASQQIRFLARAERNMNWTMPSIRAMRDALLMESTLREGTHSEELPTDQPLHLTFESLGHAYGEGAKARKVMHDVSFEVRPGEKVALIGPSGAGKSTLTQLLQRYNDPSFGRICVNGHDLHNVSLQSLRRVLGYIAQRPQVFTGTIRDNLLYGLTDSERLAMTDEKIWDMLKELGINFGDRLVQGLDTRVGRNGMKLSGGEQQRLMIAAAAMKRPRFMIVDEATSSLDAESQAAVQAGIDRVLEGESGAIIIAHRLSTVLRCDTFVVLRPIGEVKDDESQVEAIAHSIEELWRISPTFRKLAELEGVKIAV